MDPDVETAAERAATHDLLGDPGLSRQWVLRRLQKLLTADLAVHALETGLAATSRRRTRADLARLAANTGERAALLRGLIEAEGSRPYSSVGLARGASRVGGLLLGLFGPWLWRPLLVRLTAEACSEIDALYGLARGALGVSPDLADALHPWIERSRADLASLREA